MEDKMNISRKNNLKYTLSIATAITLTSIASAQAENTTLKDGAYVSLTGTVGKIIDTDEFMLKTKMGDIKVDTNDNWPMLFGEKAGDNFTNILTTGDRVTVRGNVDDNYFTKKEIDATNIGFTGQGYTKVYYHKDSDMNDSYWFNNDKQNDDTISLSGSVAKIIDEDEFLLNYVGGGTIRVETDDIEINDSNQIRVGEAVTVYGEIEESWYGKKELEATSINRQSSYY
jgi:uncharacterized protein YdeI (BOF family)